MKFQIGRFYQHSSGKVIRIIDKTSTFFHGHCLLAECDNGKLIPISRDESATDNYHEVSGWPREIYKAQSIPEPTELSEGGMEGPDGDHRPSIYDLRGFR